MQGRYLGLGLALLAGCAGAPPDGQLRSPVVQTTPVWTIEGATVSARLGGEVAAAGDINGDGYDDFTISEITWSGSFTGEGRVLVMFGSAQGPVFGASIQGGGADLGLFAREVGDVNGDGYADVLCTSSRWSNGQDDEGGAWLYAGGSGGLASAPAWSWESDVEALYAHAAQVEIGDIDGDGYADVGLQTSGGAHEGRIWVFHGGPSWPATSPDQTLLQGPQSLITFLFGVGDIDADGNDDVIVTDRRWSTSQVEVGKASLHLGSATGLQTTSAWTVFGDQANEWLGQSVGATDVNGDGWTDVILGSYRWTGTATTEGRAQLFDGTAAGVPGVAPSWSFAHGEENGLITKVRPAGDLNRDGYGDLAIGSHNWWPFSGYIGRVFVAHGGAAGPPTDPLILAAPDGSGRYGENIAGVGDTDGDGGAELLVGDRSWDDLSAGHLAADDHGRAYLHAGDRALPADVPDWQFVGAEADQQLGGSEGPWSAAADLNGDGFDDLIVGDPGFDGGLGDQGRALAFLGSASGLAATPDWSEAGGQAGAAVGWSLGAGDMNGDGWEDLLLGAPDHDGAVIDGGQVRYIPGSSAGLGTTSWTLEGDAEGERLGAGLAVADLNCDGLADLALGSPDWDGGGADVGRVQVVYGAVGGLPTTADLEIVGTQGSSEFGAQLGSGDVNGDGCQDLVVGAPSWDGSAGVDAGAAWVYLGGAAGLAGTPSWAGGGAGPGDAYGTRLGGIGDLDGDGREELMVSAPAADTAISASTEDGLVYVYPGSAAGPAAGAAYDLEGDQLSARQGRGDVDDDGHPDFVIGSPVLERAHLLCGEPGVLPTTWCWSSDQVGVGPGFTDGFVHGDYNGDGFHDLVSGAPEADTGALDGGALAAWWGGSADGGAPVTTRPRAVHEGTDQRVPRGGRSLSLGFDVVWLARSERGPVRLKMQLEVKAQGEDFDGTGLAETPYTHTGSAGVELTLPVTALSPGTAYHWRARLAVDPAHAPGQTYGGWAYGDAGFPAGVHLRTWPDTDGDGVVDALDCEPLDPAVFPGAVEVCDGDLEDCDGTVDGSFDLDVDGAFDGDDPGCAATYGAAADCDDGNADVNPAGIETCAPGDEDCDGLEDADDPDTDQDGDGFSPCAEADPDCNDADVDVFPGAEEFCDELDSDCDDSLVDQFPDLDGDGDPDCVDVDIDGDGFTNLSDCAPENPNVFPGAEEVCDGADTDCTSGLLDDEGDGDGDGWLPCDDFVDNGVPGINGGGDCDDEASIVHPGAAEIPGNGLDDDCAGDGDAAVPGGGSGSAAGAPGIACSCSSGGGGGGAWLFGAFIALRRRRRLPGA